jgi:deazaflavin-dependent oxidoreductase (nitroreductase family)
MAKIYGASNFGRPRNPAWYYNLRANPNATIARNGMSREVVARELSGSERKLAATRRSSPASPSTAAGQRIVKFPSSG